MVRTACSLLAIGAVCGMLLAATDQLTALDITLNRELHARGVMADMLAEPIADDLDIQQSTFGQCHDWVFQHVQTRGYAGNIDILVLWRALSNGLVLRVTGHRETPGIGDFIDHARTPWITELDDQPVSAYSTLDNVSGATITTAAIRRAAQRAQQHLEDYCAA